MRNLSVKLGFLRLGDKIEDFVDSALCSYLAVSTLIQITVGKSTHFIG